MHVYCILFLFLTCLTRYFIILTPYYLFSVLDTLTSDKTQKENTQGYSFVSLYTYISMIIVSILNQI